MDSEKESIQKSSFDVLNLCCSSEVALVERILYSLRGVKNVSVIVPSKTVIVVHNAHLISTSEIAKALNQAKMEANVRISGEVNHLKKWPSPYVLMSGVLLALSFLKYVYTPLQWLAVAAVVIGIWPILKKGLAAVCNLSIDVNILVLVAVIGTLALRDYWESGTIVFLFTISDWLQSRAYHRATAAMSSLMSIAPQKAIIAETGEVVNVADVSQNTILSVKAGEAIPVDGIVVEGSCEVDEKALTGEAFPVAKQKDSAVWAGTINLNGYITVKATALAEECVVAKMAKLVEAAQNKRPRIQRLIDKCAKYYTPAVVLISAGLAVVPAALRFSDLNEWFHLALVVLVSACPCGLILSTPVATFCTLSKAATNGLLIKGGDYIETLAMIKVAAFDKTGTITRGEFIMSGFRSLCNEFSMNKLLYWVSSIESKSSHPIANALVNYGQSLSIEPKPELVEEFQNFTGEGISGKIDGRQIYVGNRKFGHRAGCVAALEIENNSEDGRTLGFVYSDGAVIGTFNLLDACRSGAIDAIKELKSMGITTVMLTGDNKAAAMLAQSQLGYALDVVHAELLPEEKAMIIEDYKKSGRPIAMVGDGINDALALATADVGISMGVSGSALAAETSHVILMSNDIKKIPEVIELAKRTRRKVIENIAFAMGTKVVILALALVGYPIVWLAVLADVLSCLLVILNSMTLLRQRNRQGGSPSKSYHHANDHNMGCCRGSSVSQHYIHGNEKKRSCHGSLRFRCHCHDDKKIICHGSSCCMVSDGAGKRCESAKCSSQESSSTCKTNKKNSCSKKSTLIIERSSHGCECASVTSWKKCCESITCNEKDSCDDVDGHDRCCLPSDPIVSCKKECRDLEGQRCLRGDDCELNEGKCVDKCSPGEHVIAKDHSAEASSSRGGFGYSKKECNCCTGSGSTHAQLTANEQYACNTSVGGNREISGGCESFREECCQVLDHQGFRSKAPTLEQHPHNFVTNSLIQDLTKPLLDDKY